MRNVLKFKNIIEKPVPAEQIKKFIIKRVLDQAKQSPNTQINFDKVSIENVNIILIILCCLIFHFNFIGNFISK